MTTSLLAALLLPTSAIGNPLAEQEQAVVIPRSSGDKAANLPPDLQTSEDWNRRLKEMLHSSPAPSVVSPREYRIGSEDVLEINVFAAPELNRQVRVSAEGEISFPLLGEVRAAGLTPMELEVSLQELLRRTYMKDPQVSVLVRDMQSHPLSVVGAVRRPGVFQVRGPRTLLEALALAEGLSDDAGDTVMIMHGAGLSSGLGFNSSRPTLPVESLHSIQATEAGPSTSGFDPGADAPRASIQVNLRDLLNSADPDYNPLVYPGDIVKVARAGIVYVVGEVRKPGGFALKSNDKISVLQAIALSEGLTRTAAKSGVRVIRTDPQSGERTETTINLAKVMTGKAPDPILQPKDIVFVPDSVAKTTLSRGAEAAAQTLTGLLIFHW
jgi:polysaccharide biosynthesis/export protein